MKPSYSPSLQRKPKSLKRKKIAILDRARSLRLPEIAVLSPLANFASVERTRCTARSFWRSRKGWAWLGVLVISLAQSLLAIPSLAGEIDVLSYNVFMRPFFHDGQRIRAWHLRGQLSGFDAIVFQELYDDAIRRSLIAGLRKAYPFSTRIVGEDAGIRQDGGVIIVSKWPIVLEGQRVFTEGKPSVSRCPGPDCCAGTDCFAEKGVVYALINKAGRCYHLFGTHLQAGIDDQALRNEQLRIIKQFITSRPINNNEPVIIAGDMNVNRYDEARFARMQGLLAAEQPALKPTAPPAAGKIYTFDGPGNDLNDNEGIQRYVDYVLYSVDHLKPTSGFNQVRTIRSPCPWRQYFWDDLRLDLSDHYAVLGHFSYAQTTSSPCPARGE